MKKTNKLVTLSLLFGFVSVLPMSCVFAGGPNKNTSAQPPAPISSNNNPTPSADFNNSIQQTALPSSNPGQNQIYTNPTAFPPMFPKPPKKPNIRLNHQKGEQLTFQGTEIKKNILEAIYPYYRTTRGNHLICHFNSALDSLGFKRLSRNEKRNINKFYNRMATYNIYQVSQFIQTLISLSVSNTPPPTPLPPISELNCPFEIPPGFFNS